jgi:hypothetical protein
MSNIQNEVTKIHYMFGTSEMANYKIQLLFDKLIIQAQIDILSEHIEHPNKPGYKRKDILDKIKLLKNKLDK